MSITSLMKILAVETATSRQSVAVLEGPRVLARSDEEAAGSQARLLIPTIDRLLKTSGLSLPGLEGRAGHDRPRPPWGTGARRRPGSGTPRRCVPGVAAPATP